MSSSTFFELLGMLLAVVAILVLAYVCTRYMGKLRLGRFKPASSGDGHMKILDQMTVGQDMRLLLVQVGTRTLLLATSTAGVTTLAELTEEDAALWLSEADEDAATSSGAKNPSFRDSFVEVLKQRRK